MNPNPVGYSQSLREKPVYRISVVELARRTNIFQPLLEQATPSEYSLRKRQLIQGEIQNKPLPERFKSKGKSFMYALIICLSAINFGYALTAVSVVNIPQLKNQYGITLSTPETNSILIGMMPIGGIFGAAFNQLFLKFFNRKQSLYIMLVILWAGLGMILVRNMYTIIIGRFVEGLAIGLYVSISPILLQEVTPKELRPKVMTMFGLSKSFGCVLANILQQICIAANWNNSSVFLLVFNGFIAIIQAILYFFVIPNSPLGMIEVDDHQKAKQAIAIIYQEQYQDQVYKELLEDYRAGKGDVNEELFNDRATILTAMDIRSTQLRRAYWFAIHVIILRQFIGGNCLITFSGQIIKQFNAGLAIYMALILNSVQFLGDLLSVLFLTGNFGRRPILMVGTMGMAICSLIIAMALITSLQIVILVFMVIFMALYGANILTIAWGYPSEILTPKVTMIPNIIGWIATAMVTSIPPLVVGVMPNGNAYPLFIFFGAYGIFSYVILHFYMVESKGRTYEQIIDSF